MKKFCFIAAVAATVLVNVALFWWLWACHPITAAIITAATVVAWTFNLYTAYRYTRTRR